MDNKEYQKLYRLKNKEKIKEYHKEYYKNNIEIYKERDKKIKKTEKWRIWKRQYQARQRILHPEKIKANDLIRKLHYQAKKINREPCQICGEIKTQFHHFDYLKPLEVYHLCLLHHRQVHKNIIDLNNITPFDYSSLA
jgi:hypothetical protein